MKPVNTTAQAQPAGGDRSGPRAVEAELADLAAAWPWPGPADNKYTRGVVAIDTGSAQYPGAAVLSVLGAAYAGAGYIKYTGPARAEVLAAAPDVVCPGENRDVTPGGLAAVTADAWLVGCGWGLSADTPQRLKTVLQLGKPTVVDAEAIQLFRRRCPAPGPVLMTPHAGELAQFLSLNREDVEQDPVAAVREACAQSGATVLLKGATQYAATPGDSTTYICLPGPAWTARAGSGDVLAGIAAALLAQGLPPVRAAWLAGSIQALAAVRHPGPYPPWELVRFLPEVIASLCDQ